MAQESFLLIRPALKETQAEAANMNSLARDKISNSREPGQMLLKRDRISDHEGYLIGIFSISIKEDLAS